MKDYSYGFPLSLELGHFYLGQVEEVLVIVSEEGAVLNMSSPSYIHVRGGLLIKCLTV